MNRDLAADSGFILTLARQSALVAIVAGHWLGPWLLPIEPLLSFEEGSDPAGWYVAFALTVSLLPLAVWTVAQDLPRLEGRGRLGQNGVWWLALVAALLVLVFTWASHSPSPQPNPEVIVGADAWSGRVLRHVLATHLVLSILVPTTVALVSRALNAPIDLRAVPLARWVLTVAFVAMMTPTPFAFSGLAAMFLFALASCTVCLQQLSVFEQQQGFPKWRARLFGLCLGVPILWPGEKRIQTAVFEVIQSSWAPTLCSVLLIFGICVAFVVVCLAAADGLAWALSRSRSVRQRMLALGLVAALAAFALAGNDTPAKVNETLAEASPLLSLVFKLALAIVMVFVLSMTLSRRLSQSLEQSVHAMTRIRAGNLDVALDESGKDEVAEVAKSVNGMVAQLREAEFLETINADLRARSDSLTRTLDALRIAQAELVRSERMASVATLVRGIAHELNNPINYIAGNMAPLKRYCRFLTEVAAKLSDGRARSAEQLQAFLQLTERKDLKFVSSDLARLTDDISEGARRAQLIITDLQNLTSAAQRGLEQVDLHKVARQTLSLLEPRRPAGVSFATKLEPVPLLTARAGQIEQVLLNLADNALRAVGNQGNVAIYVAVVQGAIVVRVSDDGPGMSDDVQRQALEPFFTTRAAGEGSGLGLAIVASIVRAHQGKLTLSSEAGRGTNVEVLFSSVPDAITRAESPPGPALVEPLPAGA